MVGCPVFVLATKLEALKSILKNGIVKSLEMFTYVLLSIQMTRHDLRAYKNVGYNDLLVDEESKAQHSLDEVLEEYFWRNKTENNWFKDGDRNTRFFHSVVKIRHAKSNIAGLKHGHVYLEDGSEIENHVINYSKQLFNIYNNCIQSDLVKRFIPQLITQSDDAFLTTMP